MRIVVPTYRRHSNGEAQTLTHVPREIGLTLVVRQGEEAERYAGLLGRLGRTEDNLWVIPEGSVDGIATTRQWIIEEAISRGESKIMMIDDDLHFICRGKMDDPTDDVHLRPCDVSDYRSMFHWVEDSLDDYAHAAISMREGNNRIPGFHAYDLANRGIRAVAYNLQVVQAVGARFREEVEGREDLDMTLQLLRAGHANIVSYHWAQGQRTADAPGGLEGTRDGAQLDATAVRLSELHPGFVKLRTKVNKSGAMRGERTEVTVYWKRALQSAPRRQEESA